MAKNNLLSKNIKSMMKSIIKSIKKEYKKEFTVYNFSVDMVVIIMLFLFYLGSIVSISVGEETIMPTSKLNITITFLIVIMLIGMTLKYSIVLGLIISLILIFMMVFRKKISNYLLGINLSNNFRKFKNKGHQEKKEKKEKKEKTNNECPKLKIDINSPLTEEEFRLVQKLILCDMHEINKCFMLGIDIDNQNSSYNRKIRKRYHPDLKKNYEKLNITYDEMNEVSAYIGGCINKQYMYQEKKKKKEQREQNEKKN